MAFYCYATRPQKELTAAEILSRVGFTALVPLEIKTRRKSRRYKQVIEFAVPLMRGYVFIEITDGQWWTPFRYDAVRSIVGVAGKPIVISDKAIDYLASLSGTRSDIDIQPQFQPGQKVEVSSGPLEGMTAKIKKVKGKKATAIINMLCAEREMILDVALLREAA